MSITDINVWYLVFGLGVVIVIAGILVVGLKRDDQGRITIEYRELKASNVTQGLALVLIGLVATGYSAFQIRNEQAGNISPVRILRIEGVPPFPDLESVPEGVERDIVLAEWLQGVFQASVRVQAGRNQAIDQGSLLAVVSEEALPTEAIGRLDLGSLADDSSATLRVLTVYDQESISRLEDFAIEAFTTRLPSELEVGAEYHPLGVETHVAFPIPADEAASFSAMLELEQRALEPDIDEDLRDDRLAVAARTAADFLSDYPNSFFAPDAMFSTAYLAWQRGRTDEAVETYERFIRRYPRSVSVEGAQDSIDAIRRGEAPGGSPEATSSP